MTLNALNIKTTISTQLTNTENSILAKLQEIKTISNMSPDNTEVAESNIERAKITSEITRLNHRKVQLVKANLRIKNDQYGDCQECGNEIAAKRLMKHPESEFCVECLSDIEKRNKQYA